LTVNGTTLVKLQPKPWELSTAECESLGGSILNVLTNMWENIVITQFQASGYGTVIVFDLQLELVYYIMGTNCYAMDKMHLFFFSFRGGIRSQHEYIIN